MLLSPRFHLLLFFIVIELSDLLGENESGIQRLMISVRWRQYENLTEPCNRDCTECFSKRSPRKLFELLVIPHLQSESLWWDLDHLCFSRGRNDSYAHQTLRTAELVFTRNLWSILNYSGRKWLPTPAQPFYNRRVSENAARHTQVIPSRAFPRGSTNVWRRVILPPLPPDLPSNQAHAAQGQRCTSLESVNIETRVLWPLETRGPGPP